MLGWSTPPSRPVVAAAVPAGTAAARDDSSAGPRGTCLAGDR